MKRSVARFLTRTRRNARALGLNPKYTLEDELPKIVDYIRRSKVCNRNRMHTVACNFKENCARAIYNPLPQLSPIDMVGDDFGYLGGPSIQKGFEVLCRALAFLNDHSLLVHATNFSQMQSTMARSLKKLRIVPYRRFGHREILMLYRKIRGVLVPSIVAEPSPYVVLEAILRSRVVVASKIGGIPELVEGCKGVFLFEAGNYEQLGEKMLYVKDLSREAIADWGTRNREIIIRRFSNEKTSGEFIRLLNMVSH